ncbi:hypothetical protein ABZX74_46910 [Streptomyces olivaceoviridis]|uniref:hypothetical protein n=1 Tax=Streptomyces olivaceoviridis TaxID=1921 RepID=UPI0033B2038D
MFAVIEHAPRSAALLGHLDIQTTRGYVAVFDKDIIAHYTEFLDRRRAKPPPTKYRHPSNDEWNDFQEHYDKRKVELGSCGRPNGTPCAHEHACIRYTHGSPTPSRRSPPPHTPKPASDAP